MNADSSRMVRMPRSTTLNRPILLVAIVVGVASYFALAPFIGRPIVQALIGWDACVLVLLFLTYALIVHVGGKETEYRIVALRGKGNRLLIFSILASVASIVGLGNEAVNTKTQHDGLVAITLTVSTVLLSWTLIQTVFALRYAHEYFMVDDGSQRNGGLNFGPECEPDFWDFVHFSIVVGAAAQTADIPFTTKRMRRIGTLHTLVAFGFNTAILATSINVLLSALPEA